jgi:hypothetical protein
MKLTEVFAQLSYGELSSLKLGSSAPGTVDPSNYAKILSHVNLGLTELHKRFLLKVGTLTLNMVDGQSLYPLKSLYQIGNREGARFTQYIQASPVFADDLIKVEQVFTELNLELGLNDASNWRSVSTPSYNVLQVSPDVVKELKLQTLRVVYRANHPLIVKEDGYFDLDSVEVDLPYTHLSALLLFIASRLHNPVGFNTVMHEGNNYASKFEHECALLNEQNLRVDVVAHNTKASQKGFG